MGSTPLDIARSNLAKSGQISRNAPCPCGSKKRYKRYTVVFFIYKTNVTFYVLELFSNLFYSYIIWQARYILLVYRIDYHIGFSLHSSPDSLMKNNAYYSFKFFYTIIICKFCELQLFSCL